jgi:hypothetical protein
MNTHDIDIKLPPLPPMYIVPSVEPVDYPEVAQALMDYARTAIEADRQVRGEPFAWAAYDAATAELVFSDDDMSDSIAWFPLYTTPQPQQQTEPSGYAYRYRDYAGGTVLRFNSGEEVNGARPIEALPFWFEPQPQQIPEGYKLVPIEPTLEMIVEAAKAASQYMDECGRSSPTVIYKAMLEAAPEPKGRT